MIGHGNFQLVEWWHFWHYMKCCPWHLITRGKSKLWRLCSLEWHLCLQGWLFTFHVEHNLIFSVIISYAYIKNFSSSFLQVKFISRILQPVFSPDQLAGGHELVAGLCSVCPDCISTLPHVYEPNPILHSVEENCTNLDLQVKQRVDSYSSMLLIAHLINMT